MIDSNIIKRKNLLLHKGDVVSVLTVAKRSLRVYNISKDQYLSRWVDIKEFDYKPIEIDDIKDCGFSFIGGKNRWYNISHIYFELSIDDSEIGFVVYVNSIFLKKIKYQHELVNLVETFKTK